MTPKQYLDSAANDLAGAKQSIENAWDEDKSSVLASIHNDLDGVYERLEAYLEKEET